MSDFAYSYAGPSALEQRPEGSTLLLSAFSEEGLAAETACFFWGRLRNSWLAARGLSTLAKVVASRFVPQSAALRDPIVTAGAGQLRFEAFSSCNGVYARLDLGPEALDGEFLSSGTPVRPGGSSPRPWARYSGAFWPTTSFPCSAWPTTCSKPAPLMP